MGIQFDRLVQLALFATAFDLERIVVNAVRHTDMQIRIDHRNNCLHFGSELFEAQREDLPEGPTLQAMPSEQIRTHLISMYCVLSKASTSVIGASPTQEEKNLKADIAKLYHQNKARDHHQLLSRQKIIEDRKEYLEKLNTEREEEEVRRQEEMLRQQLAAEQRRLEVERQERERLCQEAEIRQVQARHLKEKVAQFSQTAIGQKVIKKMDDEDISKLDPDLIMARQLEELEKERKELQTKLKSQEKKVDFFERAKRIEEIPLLEKHLEVTKIANRDMWQQQEEDRIAQLLEERKVAMLHRDRLIRMRDDKVKFVEDLKAARLNSFTVKLSEFESKYENVRTERIKERKDKRREQRRIQWLNEKEEAERIEFERRQAELDELRKRKEAADLVLQKQREREREVEAKQKRKEEESREREREARDKEREEPSLQSSRGERPADSSWRKGGEPAAPVAESRFSEPYKPPTEAKWRNNRSDKYSSRPDADSERRVDNDERRERGDRDRVDRDRRDQEPSSWRSAREPPASDSRPRDREAPARGARDFAALRDPGARKTVEFERPAFRREENPREEREFRRGGGEDREIRRGGEDREIRRGGEDREIRRAPPAAREGESSWRSMRPAAGSDRPQESRGERDFRAVRGDREDRPLREDREKMPPSRSAAPATTAADREREQERERKQRKEEVDDEGFTKVISRR